MNSELTQYLQDSWKAIIDADVDGPNSEPAKIDEGKPLFGQRSLTRRLARTVFFGAAPTIGSAHKGLETQRVFLGTAIPGDVPGNFHSALAALGRPRDLLLTPVGQVLVRPAGQHLPARQGPGRAAPHRRGLRRDRRRLDESGQDPRRLRRRPRLPGGRGRHPRHRRSAPGDPAPQGSPTSAATATPRRSRSRKGATEHRGAPTGRTATCSSTSPATATASRSSSARCASTSAGRRSSPRRTTSTSPQARRTRRPSGKAKASETVDARLLGAYQWALVPTGQPIEIQATKVEGQATSLAERVSRRLGNDGALAVQHAAPAIRHQLDTTAAKLWADGHVTVGALWRLYAEYPYMPRLARPRGARRRASPGRSCSGSRRASRSPTATTRRTGSTAALVLPTDGITVAVTDATLIVQPGAGKGAAREPRSPDGDAAGARTPMQTADPSVVPVRQPPSADRQARRVSLAASACRPTATHRTSRSSPTRCSARSARRPA